MRIVRAVVLFAGLAIATAAPTALGVVAVGHGKRLPAGTIRGPEDRLLQYPAVSLANASQLAAAKRLRREIQVIARGWRNARAAASGYDTVRLRRSGDAAGLYLHAEHRATATTALLQPRQPEALIFANVPGKPSCSSASCSPCLAACTVSPGGPITRWHTHRVCARGKKRGLAPTRRHLPTRIYRQTGKRDAAFLAHERPPQRLRNPRPRPNCACAATPWPLPPCRPRGVAQNLSFERGYQRDPRDRRQGCPGAARR